MLRACGVHYARVMALPGHNPLRSPAARARPDRGAGRDDDFTLIQETCLMNAPSLAPAR